MTLRLAYRLHIDDRTVALIEEPQSTLPTSSIPGSRGA
jgi:hypothetical protein